MTWKDKEKAKAYNKAYKEKHKDRLTARNKVTYKEYRLKVLNHYSQGNVECKCCGEKQYEFLSLDHIDGGGNKHRKELGSKYIYSYLIQDNFPIGYQVLCHNCNMAKSYYGKCPHTKEINNE